MLYPYNKVNFFAGKTEKSELSNYLSALAQSNSDVYQAAVDAGFSGNKSAFVKQVEEYAGKALTVDSDTGEYKLDGIGLSVYSASRLRELEIARRNKSQGGGGASGLTQEQIQAIEAAKTKAAQAESAVHGAVQKADVAASAAAKAESVAENAASASQAATSKAESAKTAADSATSAANAAKEKAEQALKVAQSAGLTQEQSAALNRFKAEAGGGTTMKISNLTDVATTTIDAGVTTLEIASYTADSHKGGGTFKRATGTPAVSDGMIIKSKDGAIWQRVTDDGYMYPEYLGWVSSTGDDKAFLLKLFTAAGVLGLNVAFSPENTFNIIGITNIDRRVKRVDARGAKFVFGTDGKVRNGGFTYTQTTGGHFENFDISYTDALRDLNVSGSKGECCGFWFEAVNGVTVTKNKIKATNAHGILVRMKGKATADCIGNVITENIIDIHRLGANDAKQGILFDVEDSTTTAMDAYWQTNKSVYESSTARHRNHVVRLNIITGSRYGVCLYYAEDCIVEHNKVTGCIRGYVQQNKCRRNKFRFNEVYEFTSAAFLMNYNTCYSIIENNYGRSTVVNGQAPLHISVQGEGNICRFNVFDVDSGDGSAWWMYCGIACKDNTFYKNVFRGKVKRAAVMIESAWTNNDDATGSYGSQKSGSAYIIKPDWGVGHTSGTVVQDNEFHFANTTPSVPLAVIHAGTDNNGDHNLLNTEFVGNKLIAAVKPTVLFKLVEGGNSKVQGTIYGQNKWVGGATSAQLIMGNATAYADQRSDINLAAV